MNAPNIRVNQTSVEFVNWLNDCNALLEAHMAAHYPNNPKECLEASQGNRYIKIVHRQVEGTVRFAWAFIDRTNGDVLKPAGWNAPAKHARGNIFDEQKGMGSIGPYGPAYIRGSTPSLEI